MEFGFGEKETLFKDEIREFVRENIPVKKYWIMLDEGETDEDWAFIMSISKKLAKKKWLTLSWPKEYGGLGVSHIQKMVFEEEVGYWGIPGTTMGISGTGWVGPSLMIFGSDEQKKTYLPPIAAGDEDGVWCTGYSEPDSGSDLASMQTYAERVGDEYIINGQKVWTSCAHHSRWMWLAARTDRNCQKKHDGISLFLVDMQSDGLKVNPLKNFVGHHLFNEVFFDEVKIPARNLVGTENRGWAQLMTALSFERGMAIGASGMMRRLIDELVEYVKGTGQIHDPLVRFRLADLVMEVEKLSLLGREAVWKVERGDIVIHEPSRDKAFVDELLDRLTQFGVEVLEGYSQMDPLRKDDRWTRLRGMIEQTYYFAIGMSIAGGTTDTQRNIVANFGLQLPRS
ncbi:acyl-CoA dehydrogenase family protein [bacterium]|nr:acyl-CoA dehydrogenase family protein [bacterium]